MPHKNHERTQLFQFAAAWLNVMSLDGKFCWIGLESEPKNKHFSMGWAHMLNAADPKIKSEILVGKPDFHGIDSNT